NSFHAVRRREDAGVEARTAWHIVYLHHHVPLPPRAVPLSSLWAEERRHRYTERVGNVHRAAVAAQKEIALSHERHEAAEVTLDASRPVAGRDLTGVALRFLENEHLRTTCLNEGVDHGGKSIGTPAADDVTRAWVHTDNWPLVREAWNRNGPPRVRLLPSGHCERAAESIP